MKSAAERKTAAAKLGAAVEGAKAAVCVHRQPWELPTSLSLKSASALAGSSKPSTENAVSAKGGAAGMK